MFNQIVMVGRITKDPELNTSKSGLPVVSFAIACEKEKAKDQQSEVEYFNCVAWRNTADYIAKYVTKGTLLLVSGRLQNRSYEDKVGRKIYITEIICETVKILSKPKGNHEYKSTDEEIN